MRIVKTLIIFVGFLVIGYLAGKAIPDVLTNSQEQFKPQPTMEIQEGEPWSMIIVGVNDFSDRIWELRGIWKITYTPEDFNLLISPIFPLASEPETSTLLFQTLKDSQKCDGTGALARELIGMDYSWSSFVCLDKQALHAAMGLLILSDDDDRIIADRYLLNRGKWQNVEYEEVNQKQILTIICENITDPSFVLDVYLFDRIINTDITHNLEVDRLLAEWSRIRTSGSQLTCNIVSP